MKKLTVKFKGEFTLDEERFNWCEEANIELYKIASRTVEDKKLCEKIINSKKKVIISNSPS